MIIKVINQKLKSNHNIAELLCKEEILQKLFNPFNNNHKIALIT